MRVCFLSGALRGASGVRASRLLRARQEVQEQPVDLGGSLELYPVAGALQALVAPRSRGVPGGARHLLLGEREVAAAPGPHGRRLDRGELQRWFRPGPGWPVGPIPV